MAMTTSANTELQAEYALRRFLQFLKPQLQFYKYATEGSVPEGMGKTVRWFDFPKMDVDTSALSETNAGDNEISSYTATEITGDMEPYGQFLKISDHAARTMVLGTLDAISERFAELGARTVDTLLQTQALTTTNFLACGQGNTTLNTGASIGTLRATDFSTINAYFQGIGAGGFESEGGQYSAVLHPNQIAHLQAEPSTVSGLPTWSEVNKHIPGSNGQGKILNGNAGSLFNVALKSSPLISIAVYSGTSGYQGVAMAKDGVGRAGLSDMEPSVIIKKPGSQDTSQPLNTYHTYGVKFRSAQKLLDAARVVKVWSAR